MKDVEKLKQLLLPHKEAIKNKYKVKEISVFGSYVREESKPDSDMDILVEFYEPIGFFLFLELEEYLQELLGVRIDLVSKKALKPRIGEYILKEAIAL